MVKRFKKTIVSLGVATAFLANLPQLSVGAFSKELKANLANCTITCNEDFALYFSALRALHGAESWENDDLLFTLDWTFTNSATATAKCITTTNTEGILAVTVRYSNTIGGQMDPDVNDWNYAFILGNKMCSSNALTTAVMAHEIGHVMGLSDHNSSPSSIMCELSSGRTATVPSQYDRATLSFKYRNRN